MVNDLIGQRFGRLTVIARLAERQNRKVMWRCRCQCGNETTAQGARLRSGITASCGCLKIDQLRARNISHGESQRGSVTTEYRCWSHLKERCLNMRSKDFRHYGGRGIKICDRWPLGDEQRSGYECFLADMGRKPTAGHSIDRVDVNGNYEPSNCRWALDDTQAQNRRSNRILSVFGENLPVSVAAKRYDINEHALHKRLRLGWSAERALTTPSRKAKKQESFDGESGCQ